MSATLHNPIIGAIDVLAQTVFIEGQVDLRQLILEFWQANSLIPKTPV